MTINSDVRVAGPFTATGGVQVLPFTFRIFNVNDVIVVVTNLLGIDSTLINQTGFTVAMNADQDVSPGGTVTITSTLNFKLTLSTALPNTQPTQVTNGGPFNATVITAALDRLAILIQQVANATARSLKFPISDGALVTTLPNVVARAGKILGFDALGNFIVSNLTLTQIEDVTTTAQAAAATATTQAGIATTQAGLSATARVGAEAAQAAAEAAASGFRFKNAVRAATTGVLPACTYANGASGVGATLTGNVNGALAAQDGISLLANEAILVKNQAATLQNGIYRLTQVGTGGTPFILTRRTDMDVWSEVNGASVSVDEGTTNLDTAWLCTSNTGGTMGTTPITWTPFPSFIADASINADTKLINNTLTYAKLVSSAIASNAQAIAGTANKLMNAAIFNALALIKTQAAVATTSGTTWPQTGIAATAQRLAISFSQFGTNGTSQPILQLGTSGGYVTTGYTGSGSQVSGSAASSLNSDGFSLGFITGWLATARIDGVIYCQLLDATDNTWSVSGVLSRTDTAATHFVSGKIVLPAVLDRARVTTQGGANTGTNGKISFAWES